MKKIEIIGEAIKNIPRDIKAKYKTIPWRDIVGMRDKITHAYFGIDYEIVWKVVKEKLPALKIQVEQEVKDGKENMTGGLSRGKLIEGEFLGTANWSFCQYFPSAYPEILFPF